MHTTIPDVAFGAVVASLIAGLVSLLGLIISKEQKTSEFRQTWIDSLRAEISALISHANAIHGAFIAKSPEEGPSSVWKNVREDFVGINQATASIRLRLNGKERPSQAILKTIEDIEKLFKPGTLPDITKLNGIEKRLVNEVNFVLKAEWGRVKEGEPVFQFAKYLAFAVVTFTLVLGIVAAVQRLAVHA